MKQLIVLIATIVGSAAMAAPAAIQLRDNIKTKTVYAVGVEGQDTAKVAIASGYNTLFLSGSWVTKVVHDKPDIGYYTAQDAASLSQKILKAHPNIILIVDVDGGFGKLSSTTGSASNIDAAVRAAIRLDKMGVAGIVIDDQEPTKRKAEVDPGKAVIASRVMESMIKKIRAATSPEFVIIGRTAAEAKKEALTRANMLKRAGSDLIIVEAINSSQSGLRQFKADTKFDLTTIQLDKGEAKPWTRKDHKDIGVQLVLLANALRKRWPDKTAGLAEFNAQLDLQLSMCVNSY